MKFQFKNIIPAALLLLGMGVSSCVGDLDVTPIDPSTNMTVDATALYRKCYSNMAMAGQGGANGDCDIDGIDGGTSGYVRQIFNANTLTTDEGMCCWGDEGIPAFNFNQWTSNHPMLEGLYYRLYLGVTLCNHYLDVCGSHDKTMTAEVRFLRAMYYFQLMDLWGNVPFLETMSDENAPQIARADLFNWVEKELLAAEEDMLEARPKSSSDSEYGRADKASAWLLLSRLYLNAEVYSGTARWADAATYAQKVMNAYPIFKGDGMNGWTAYQMLFMGDNGENGAAVEAVLPLLQDGATTTSWGTTLFLMASCFKDDMKINGESANGVTELWSGNRARPDLVAKFFPNNNAPNGTMAEVLAAAGDDRALFWGKDRNLNVDNTAEFTEGFSVCKFNNHYATAGQSHNSQFPDADYFLLRSAEAYLTYAEATAREAGTGYTTEAGTAAINELRQRAHASTSTGYSLSQICDEWSREFYFEGIRRPTLVRFGYFGGINSYRWQWKGGVQGGTYFDAHLNLFAIPESDIIANSKLEQNPGY